MLYILWGEDDFSLGEALEEIKRSISDQELLAVNTTVLDGQQVSPDKLSAVCGTVPFMSEKRLVIAKGLLERFEPKSKPRGRKKSSALATKRDEYKPLLASLSAIPDSTILVLIDGKLKSSNPLFKALSARAEVKSFPLLRNTELRQWIQTRVKKEGGSMSPKTVDLLAKLVGSNLWVMKNEIDKLVLFTSGRRIEEEDVKQVATCAQQTNVFVMVDAILAFKAKIAEQSLHQLLEAGAAPTYLLVMIARQVRMVVRAKELRNQGKHEVEIQGKLGLTAEFALRKTLEQAARYPLARLKEVYRKLLETDLSIKTGKYEGELALNILIAELVAH